MRYLAGTLLAVAIALAVQQYFAAGSTARHVQGYGGDRRNRRTVLAAQAFVRTVDGDEAWAQGQG